MRTLITTMVVTLILCPFSLARIRVVEAQADLFEAAEYYAAATKGRYLTAWEVALIRNNVNAVITRHTFVERGRAYLGADIEHFVHDHRERGSYEERLSRLQPGRFDTIFAGRVTHIQTCPICSSLVRELTRFMAITPVSFTPNTDVTALSPTVLINGKWVPVTYHSTRWDRGFYGLCGTYLGDLTFVYATCGIDRAAYDDIGRATCWFVEHRGLLLPIRFFEDAARGRKPDAPPLRPAVAQVLDVVRPILARPPGVQDFEFETLELPPRTSEPRVHIAGRPRPRGAEPVEQPPPTEIVAEPTVQTEPSDPPLSLGEVRAHLRGLVLDARGLVDALTRTDDSAPPASPVEQPEDVPVVEDED